MKVELGVLRYALLVFVSISLADANHFFTHTAVDFVGRSEEHERTMPRFASSLQNVEGATQIYFEIQTGIGERRGHGNLRRKVIDLICGGDCSLHKEGIANIAYSDAETRGIRRSCSAQRFQICCDPGPRKIIEDVDMRVSLLK